jgi:hypothetical protein
MLIPQHPKSVARRRAVPELCVAYKQSATISPGHVVEVAHERAPTDELVASGQGAPGEPPICFSVIYRLPQYLAILREYLPVRLLEWERSRGSRPRQRLSWSARLVLAWMVPLVGTPMFLLKKRRMPVCRFTIDRERIVREAGGGRLDVPWREVVAVHRLAGAWLIDVGRGGLPLPHRCLDAAQRAAFERLLVSRFGHDTPI